MMRKLCIDFGCGYNPKWGYKTCDITTSPMLDYQYDGKNDIIGLEENSVDVFYLRNVVHHIPDLQRTFATLKKYLKHNGKLIIIDCRAKHFDANVVLDKVWYRFVGHDNDIYIAESYRDYTGILLGLGFKRIFYKQLKEKEKTVYEKN